VAWLTRTERLRGETQSGAPTMHQWHSRRNIRSARKAWSILTISRTRNRNPAARHWRSLGDQLRIDVTHDGLGHVTLMVRLRQRPYADDWDLAIPVSVGVGAEMTALTDRFDLYFRDVPT
jgi:hypothetical protein